LPPGLDRAARLAALADAALASEQLPAALRCYAAAGDVARARYLWKVKGSRWQAMHIVD
jgi:hypothetical protein